MLQIVIKDTGDGDFYLVDMILASNIELRQ